MIEGGGGSKRDPVCLGITSLRKQGHKKTQMTSVVIGRFERRPSLVTASVKVALKGFQPLPGTRAPSLPSRWLCAQAPV
jgi:hypothetical protein